MREVSSSIIHSNEIAEPAEIRQTPRVSYKPLNII